MPRAKRLYFAATLEIYFRTNYLPAVRRKRSWQLDERLAVRHIFPVLGARPLDAISRADVEAWLLGMKEKGYASSTCNRVLSVLKAVCSLAVREGRLAASPCAGVRPLTGPIYRERTLSLEQARQLMTHLMASSRPEAVAILLLLLTGARKSEILKARREDVRLNERLLVVPLSKSGRTRHIQLSAEAADLIRNLISQGDSPWLFPGRVPGKPLADVYCFWNQTRKALKLEGLRIHDLRHSFASFLINSGRTLYDVQQLLGHADPRTTMRYAHLGRERLLEAAESLAGMVAGIEPSEKEGRQEKKREKSTVRLTVSEEEKSEQYTEIMELLTKAREMLESFSGQGLTKRAG